MRLQSLSYCSAAVAIPSQFDIQHLLKHARIRNERESVTGILLYSDGSFHQYLEGPSEGLDQVFAAICRDPLHHRIFEMLREPIEQREFSEWSMGYRGTSLIDGVTDDATLSDLLADESNRLSGGRLLLNAYWVNGFGARYLAALKNSRPRAQ